MLFEEQTIYAAIAVIGVLVTGAFAAWTRQFRGPTRRHMLLAPTLTGLLTLGYVGMATETMLLYGPEGEPVYATRFVTYAITYPFLGAYAGAVADAGRRYVLAAFLGLWAFVGGAMAGHLAPAPFDSVANLVVLAGFGVTFWLLLRPYTTAAASVSGGRRLLFGKVRNLQLLLLTMYLVVALTTRQALGLLDAFGGIYVSAYLDLFGHVAYGGILLRSRRGVADLAETYDSPLAVLSSNETDRGVREAPADD